MFTLEGHHAIANTLAGFLVVLFEMVKQSTLGRRLVLCLKWWFTWWLG